MKKKNIVFILDSFELYSFFSSSYPMKTYCYSYFDTELAIRNKLDNIITYDLGHLSFDLENLGYDIFIGYDGHTKQFYTGMSTTNGKELRFGHNLRKLLLGGALDNDLGIVRNNYYYDSTKSTSELCQDEIDKTSILPKALEIAKKTIGFDIKPTKFEDVGKEIKRVLEKATNGRFTTNRANGITDQLIAKTKEMKKSIKSDLSKGFQKVSEYLNEDKTVQ